MALIDPLSAEALEIALRFRDAVRRTIQSLSHNPHVGPRYSSGGLLAPDRTDRSYIISTANVAGQPEAVLKRAQQAVMIKDAIE